MHDPENRSVFLFMKQQCTKCSLEKDYSHFPKSKQKKQICKSCKSEYDREHYQKNKKRRLEQSHKYNSIKVKDKAWYKRECEYMKKRRRENPHIFRWRDIFNNTLKQVKDNKKSSSTIKHMGYSSDEFKTHIENQFNQDQSWENVSIDHKVPITWFKKETPLHLVNHLENLQVLSLEENIAKSNYFSSKISLDYKQKIIIFIQDKYKNKIPT
jgi:hypothetical protein